LTEQKKKPKKPKKPKKKIMHKVCEKLYVLYKRNKKNLALKRFEEKLELLYNIAIC
jgi:hypothetical protein